MTDFLRSKNECPVDIRESEREAMGKQMIMPAPVDIRGSEREAMGKQIMPAPVDIQAPEPATAQPHNPINTRNAKNKAGARVTDYKRKADYPYVPNI